MHTPKHDELADFMIREQWILPEGIEEILPPLSWQVESARRALLDLFRGWGYELIIPPLIEYLESLLTGTGNDLDLQTFKLTDQLNGRLMGVRADMTPQAARIDATPLMSELPTRLCYLGTVLHTRPDGFAGTRSPMQVGAELFGHAGIESDIEILSLALETLSLTGVRDVQVDLGHVGIFRALAREAGLGPDQETSLFDALQRKAVPEIGALLEHVAANGTHRERLARLAFLNGGAEVLDEARAVLEGAGTAVHDALDNLCAISAAIQARAAGIPLYFDLAELRGYNYQTGMVFAVYVPGYGQEIARGGRYDDIGRVFGRPRPATGFSTDLKTLIQIGSFPKDDGGRAIFAPSVYDPGLLACIRELRAAGEHVVCELPGQAGDAGAMGCARRLVEENGRWIVVPAGQGQGDG